MRRTMLAFAACCLLSGPLGAQQLPYAERAEQVQRVMGLMQDFYDLIERIHEVSADREKAAILQLHEIQESFKRRSNLQGVIPVYERVLASTANPTLRNVVHLKLAETLAAVGRADEAVQALNRALDENLSALE